MSAKGVRLSMMERQLKLAAKSEASAEAATDDTIKAFWQHRAEEHMAAAMLAEERAQEFEAE